MKTIQNKLKFKLELNADRVFNFIWINAMIIGLSVYVYMIKEAIER